MRDTTPETMRRWIEATRRMTPGERVARSFELTEFVERLQLGVMRRKMPNATDQEIRRYLFEKSNARSRAAGR